MHFRTSSILVILVLTVVLMSAFMPQGPKHPGNLKILPKDISHEELDKIMDGYCAALGVKCKFCHAADAADPKKIDFASDARHEKIIARSMMQMTVKINKKYFHIKDADHTGAVLAVSCMTCHNGNAHPENK